MACANVNAPRDRLVADLAALKAGVERAVAPAQREFDQRQCAVNHAISSMLNWLRGVPSIFLQRFLCSATYST
jgi:hypothetical protein